MKYCLKRLLVLTLVSLATLLWGAQPNFVVIVVDDLGWNDIGCYGSTFYETPNVDRFAKQGMRFTDAYSASPVCSPARAALMTGRHPVRVDITDWIPGNKDTGKLLQTPKDRFELALEETTLADALKAQGYATFFTGKWHLGEKGFFPEDQGFDINQGGYQCGAPMGGYYGPNQIPFNPPSPTGEYLTDRVTDESIRFLEGHRDQPFFIFHSFYTVHTPLGACKRHLDYFQKKAAQLPPLPKRELFAKEGAKGFTRTRQDNPVYASMVRAMDENVGRLLRKIDELGLAENTVVIFTSDNGGLSTLRRPSAPTSLHPLRGGKGWCYEGGIRVPLIVRAPGLTRAGTTSAQPAIGMDIFPTVMALAGIRPQQVLDGIDLTPALQGKADLTRSLYWHYPHYHSSTWTPGSAVRAGNWKLVEFYETNQVELYNLADDLGEARNLAAQYPEKAQELLQQLNRWKNEIHANLPIRRAEQN